MRGYSGSSGTFVGKNGKALASRGCLQAKPLPGNNLDDGEGHRDGYEIVLFLHGGCHDKKSESLDGYGWDCREEWLEIVTGLVREYNNWRIGREVKLLWDFLPPGGRETRMNNFIF